MIRTFMVVYKPYKGREQELLPAVKASYTDLKKSEYVTPDVSKLMRSLNDSIILIFEWKSEEMISKAQVDPLVQDHWMKLSKLGEFERPMNLVEFQQPFPQFEAIEWTDY